MISQVLTCFFTLLLSFLLFYFNVPYWTGKGMESVGASNTNEGGKSLHGVWRFLYNGLSWIGWLLYWLCEKITQLVCKVGRKIFSLILPNFNTSEERRPSVFTSIVNLLVYIGAISFLNSLWQIGLELLALHFGLTNTEIIQTFGDTAMSMENNWTGLFDSIRLFSTIWSSTLYKSGLTGLSAILSSTVVMLLAVIYYVIGNVVFFSILYGFLKEKLKEVNLARKFRLEREEDNSNEESREENEEGNSDITVDNVRQNKFRVLFLAIKKSILEFLRKQSIIKNILKKQVFALFLILLFFYSIIAIKYNWFSGGLGNIALEVIQSLDIVNILISFGITYITVAASGGVVTTIVEALPGGISASIYNFSTWCNGFADTISNVQHERSENLNQGSTGNQSSTRNTEAPNRRGLKPTYKNKTTKNRRICPICGNLLLSTGMCSNLECGFRGSGYGFINFSTKEDALKYLIEKFDAYKDEKEALQLEMNIADTNMNQPSRSILDDCQKILEHVNAIESQMDGSPMLNAINEKGMKKYCDWYCEQVYHIQLDSDWRVVIIAANGFNHYYMTKVESPIKRDSIDAKYCSGN